jgi:uncharacterized membrane protein YhaH (DUF805 family)
MTQYVPTPPSAATQPAPLDQPAYGVGPVEAVKRFFQNYAKFSGRASRSEFWWVMLAFAILYIVLAILGGVLGSVGSTVDSMGTVQPGPLFVVFGLLLLVVGLGIIVPNIALTVRRLHDANFSGFLYFIVFVPWIGSLAILIMNILPSNPAGARFDLRR